VTDYSRTVEHGRGVPGIFFKFDLEALSMTVEERTTTLYQFLIRLAGVIGESNHIAQHIVSRIAKPYSVLIFCARCAYDST
jgi:hypothetical protein